MGLKGKLIIETEIKGSAEKYYNIMKTEVHHLTSVSPDKVSAIDLHQGDWHSHGAVKTWTYTLGGKTESVKETVEHDDENKTLTLTAIDGDLLKAYKSYKVTFQAVPLILGSGGFLKITLDYEKLKESDPAPFPYFEYVINVFVEDFDAYLAKA